MPASTMENAESVPMEIASANSVNDMAKAMAAVNTHVAMAPHTGTPALFSLPHNGMSSPSEPVNTAQVPTRAQTAAPECQQSDRRQHKTWAWVQTTVTTHSCAVTAAKRSDGNTPLAIR